MKIVLVILLALILSQPPIQAKKSLNIKFENGYLYNRGYFYSNRDCSISKLNATYLSSSRFFGTNHRLKYSLQPSLYINSGNILMIRNKIEYTGAKKFNDHIFSVEVKSYYRRYFRGVKMETNSLSSRITWFFPIDKIFSLSSKIGYMKEFSQNSNKRSLYGLFLTQGFIFFLSPSSRLTSSCRLEFFEFSNLNNSGFRYGPGISFEYSRYFVFQFSWDYLFQSSRLIKEKGIHGFKILFGKIFPHDLSLFLFSEFELRDFQNMPINDFIQSYIPIKQENTTRLKLEKDLTMKLSIYMGVSYKNEVLLLNDKDFEGVESTIGFHYEL